MTSLRACVFSILLVNLVGAGNIAFYDSIPSLLFQVGATPADPWSAWEFCPFNSAVENYALYYKSDSGATGIKLQCENSPLAATSAIQDGSIETQNAAPICASGINGARSVKVDDTTGIMKMEMFCSSSAPMNIPLTGGYTDVVSPVYSEQKDCSAGHRICGVKTQLNAVKGLVGVEFACCAITADTAGESSVSCDFETNDYCGWKSAVLLVQTLSPISFPVFDRGMAPRFSYPGPTTAAQGSYFVYYFSGAPRRGTNMTGNYDPKIFSSPTYGGSTTRDPKFSFSFYADNSHLAVLRMDVRKKSDGNVIQSQLIYNDDANLIESRSAYRTPSATWIQLSFPIFANNTEFTVEFVVDKLSDVNSRVSNFGLDVLDYTSKAAGTCASPGCHANATCVNDTSVIGFTCECKTGYTGNGANVTDGCVETMPCSNNTVCLQNVTGNACIHVTPGDYSCDCGSSFYELNADNSTCVDINECSDAMFCGYQSLTNCTNLEGGFECSCMDGYTNTTMGPSNLTCALNGGWSEWSLPGDSCSKECGGGVYNATRNCTNPTKEDGGLDCEGPSFNETMACNVGLCPESCAIFKNCSACNNTQAFSEDGPLNKTLLYFNGLSANDLTWAMTQLSKWNQSVIEEICVTSYCDVAKLNSSITALSADVTKVENLITSTNSAKMDMRDILDCNPDNFDGHNEWLWEIFDTLCEYDAFLPNIREDMNIKNGMLEAERDRCMGRTHLRSLMELMYRKW